MVGCIQVQSSRPQEDIICVLRLPRSSTNHPLRSAIGVFSLPRADDIGQNFGLKTTTISLHQTLGAAKISIYPLKSSFVASRRRHWSKISLSSYIFLKRFTCNLTFSHFFGRTSKKNTIGDGGSTAL